MKTKILLSKLSIILTKDLLNLFIFLALILPSSLKAQTTLCNTYGGNTPTITWPNTGTGAVYTSTLGTLSYSGEDIVLNQNLYVEDGYNLSITSSRIKIAPGKFIIINDGATLTINGCKVFSCLGLRRWGGIKVLSGESYLYMNNSYVEDAENAIHAHEGASIELRGNRFNRNLIGISNEPYSDFHLAFTNNTITCTSELNVPFTGQSPNLWSEYGISIVGASISIGLDDLGKANTFSNLNCGINMINSIVDVNGSYFFGMRRQNYYDESNEDVYFDQEHGGNGIWASGLYTTLSISGLKGSNSGITFRDNEANGISLSSSASLYCNKVRFSNNDDWGILVATSAVQFVTRITYCSFKVSTDHGDGGIFISRSSGTGTDTRTKIQYDTFNITKPTTTGDNATGILVSCFASSNDNMDVKNNIININANRHSHAINYGIVGGSDFNRIEDNVINPNAAGLSGWGVAMNNGLGAGLHNSVYRNSILAASTDVDLDESDIWCPLHNFMCAQTHYCQNIMQGGTHGFHGGQVNNSLELVSNEFGDSYAGLRLDDWTIIGDQLCKANEFHLPNSDYYEWAASAGNSFAATSNLFWYNGSVNVQNPNNKINNAMWFFALNACSDNTPGVNCASYDKEHLLVPEITRFDRKVVDEEYDGYGGNSYLFEAKLQVYNRFFDHYAVYSTFDTLNDFMVNQASTIIGALSDVDRKIRDGFAVPSTIKSANDATNVSLKSVLYRLHLLDSIINVDEGNLLYYRTNRVAKCDTIGMHLTTLSGQFSDYDDNLMDYVTDALNILNYLTPANTPERNAIAVRRIFLESLIYQDGIYTSGQLDTLIGIAEQCPDDGGHGVGFAIGLLPVGTTYTPWPFEEGCGEERKVKDFTLQTFKNSDINIYPNPSNGSVKILSPNVIKSLYIYSIDGQLIKVIDNIDSNKYELFIKDNGNYLIKFIDNNGLEHVNKLIIQN